ncbi:MAG: NAD(P)H-dependent oxidoreductase [Candidatus Marinimicrobia bacterium]|nr:NAD(P)H-dependent oxidoreductase [Candidatus Neomarinimicrobiota bacterium]
MKDKTPDKRKHILVIDGHPDKESFCTSLAGSYVKGAGHSGYRCAFVHLSDLDFDPVLHKGYHVIQELEPDLLMLQEEIKKADHLVMVYPVWWAAFPALLKGMIDRVFLPGVMFSFHKNDLLWGQVYEREIGTADSDDGRPSPFITGFLYGNPVIMP